ncbi:MAG: hypothetical protein ACLSXO_02205 [Coprococcus sp.]
MKQILIVDDDVSIGDMLEEINKRGVWRKPAYRDGSVFIHIIFEKAQLPAYE